MTAEIDGSRVASVLGASVEAEAKAVGHLRDYYGLTGKYFTGASFETFAQAESDPYKIGTGDLLALSMLSVNVTGAGAALMMSDTFQAEATSLLKRIPVNLSFDDVGAEFHVRDGHDSTGSRLWKLIRDADGMGPVLTSKLMARKRPELFPVYDSVIDGALGLGGTRSFWTQYRDWLLKDDLEHGEPLIAHAKHLAEKAEVPRHISPLRVIDVVIWMEFHGRQPHS